MVDLRCSRWDSPPPYAGGTRVDVERSRRELETFLARRGASEFIVVQDDTSARVRFALYGNHFELVLPLPDPESRVFSHTPTGRRRTPAGQHRAYNQAMREKWRTLLFVTKGKLHAVESGISSLDHEFVTEFIPAATSQESRESTQDGRPARAPWRRVSRTVVGALGAGLLVPLAGLSAFVLPDAAVARLGALIWSAEPALFASSDRSTAASATLPLKTETSATLARVSLTGKSGSAADARVVDSRNGRTPSRDRRGDSIPTDNGGGDVSSGIAPADGGSDVKAVGGSIGSRTETAGGGNHNAIGNGIANGDSNSNPGGYGNASPPGLPSAPAVPSLLAAPAPLTIPGVDSVFSGGADAVGAALNGGG